MQLCLMKGSGWVHQAVGERENYPLGKVQSHERHLACIHASLNGIQSESGNERKTIRYKNDVGTKSFLQMTTTNRWMLCISSMPFSGLLRQSLP